MAKRKKAKLATTADLQAQITAMDHRHQYELEKLEIESIRRENLALSEVRESSALLDAFFDNAGFGTPAANPVAIRETSGAVQQNIIEEIVDSWDKQPIAGTVVEFYSLYPLSDGVSYTIPWDDVEDAIDTFWNRNRVELMQYKWATELSLHGELFLRFFDVHEDMLDRTSQLEYVKVRSLNPSTIVRVICNPEDTQEPMYYHQRYFASIPPDVLLPQTTFPTAEWAQSQAGFSDVIEFTPAFPDSTPMTETDYYKVAEVEGIGVKTYDPTMGFYAWITRRIPAREMLHVKVNELSWETRGRSDLHRVVKWIREYQSLLQSLVRLAKVASLFVYDVSVTGGEKSVRATLQRNNKPPPPGSVNVHSDQEEWNVLTPDIQAAEFSLVSQNVLRVISGGTRLASFMLGDGSDTSFAGANAQFLPVVKSFKNRQAVLRQMFIDTFAKVVFIYQYYEELDKEYPELAPQPYTETSGASAGTDDTGMAETGDMVNPVNCDFGVKLPEVADVDLLEKATAATSLIQSGVASKQTIQEWFGLDPVEQEAEMTSEQAKQTAFQVAQAGQLQKADLVPGAKPGDNPQPKPPDPVLPAGGGAGARTNTVRQGGGSAPRRGKSAGGAGRKYPNHQSNPNTKHPRRPR